MKKVTSPAARAIASSVAPTTSPTRFWDDRGVDVFDLDVAEYVKRLRIEIVNRRGLPLPQ